MYGSTASLWEYSCTSMRTEVGRQPLLTWCTRQTRYSSFSYVTLQTVEFKYFQSPPQGDCLVFATRSTMYNKLVYHYGSFYNEAVDFASCLDPIPTKMREVDGLTGFGTYSQTEIAYKDITCQHVESSTEILLRQIQLFNGDYRPYEINIITRGADNSKILITSTTLPEGLIKHLIPLGEIEQILYDIENELLYALTSKEYKLYVFHLDRVSSTGPDMGFVTIYLKPQPVPPIVELLFANIQDWSIAGCQSFRTEGCLETNFHPKIKMGTNGTLWFSDGHSVRFLRSKHVSIYRQDLSVLFNPNYVTSVTDSRYVVNLTLFLARLNQNVVEDFL